MKRGVREVTYEGSLGRELRRKGDAARERDEKAAPEIPCRVFCRSGSNATPR
jgi:hypothetical protein